MPRLMILLAIGLSIIASVHFSTPHAVGSSSVVAQRPDDRVVYQAIVERVRDGESYYAVAADEQRKGHYPLKPALTFRLPTLAWILAALPGTGWRLATLWALAAAAGLTFSASLPTYGRAERLGLTALAITGLANVGAVGSVYLHESWSIVFVVGSLAFRRSAVTSVGLAAIALLIRETAAPFLIATAIVALLRRNYACAAAFAAVCIGFGAIWLLHAAQVSEVVRASDPVSPGWLALQGWPSVVVAARWNLLLAPLPAQLVAALLPLAFLGLALWRTDEGLVCGLTVLIYVTGLLVFGRPDNNYWGVMFSPFLLLGMPALVRRFSAASARS